MVSRKKAKGKVRRAAKDAKVEEGQEEGQDQKALEAQMQRLTMDELLGESGVVKLHGLQNCRHGFEVESHEEKLYREFMTIFEDVCYENSDHMYMVSCFDAGWDAAEKKCARLGFDAAAKLREIISYCVAQGTQCILDDREDNAHTASCFAAYFEQRIAVYMEKTQPTGKWQRVYELYEGDMNTLVTFLRKRIPCKCLDNKYKDVKSMVTKMGICCNVECSLPDRKAPQKSMFWCTGCRQVCYCSPECQQTNWSEHKEDCKHWAREKAKFANDV
jgi:hypothetical protein